MGQNITVVSRKGLLYTTSLTGKHWKAWKQKSQINTENTFALSQITNEINKVYLILKVIIVQYMCVNINIVKQRKTIYRDTARALPAGKNLSDKNYP